MRQRRTRSQAAAATPVLAAVTKRDKRQVVVISARTREGIAELQEAISGLPERAPP